MTQLELEIHESKNDELNKKVIVTKLSKRKKGIIAVALLLTVAGFIVFWLSQSLTLGILVGVVPFISYKIGKRISGILKHDYDLSNLKF